MESFERILSKETASIHKKEFTYQYLKNIPRNEAAYGIFSEYRKGKLFHCLNQDMLISILQYNMAENLKISIYATDTPVNYQLKDTQNPVHYNDFIEITFVLQGSLTVMIDNEKHIFLENELYLISPNVSYQELKEQSKAVVFNISICSSHFDEMLLSDIHENSLQGFLRNCLLQERSTQKLLRFSPNDNSGQKTISNSISSIFMEYKGKKPGYLFIVKGLLIRLFDFLSSHYQFSFSEDNKKKYTSFLFQEVKEYMEKHFASIQIKDLTDKFHYQNNYFNKLIRDFTGMSYSEYLIFIRVEIAKKLLAETDMNVEDIMVYVGYHNKGFFYKIFKNSTGLTPAGYRRKS